ncbi:hypothetical protein [Dictyobacter kobayashii]|uniref:Uncharacterized protein n=1 Tax=Dictyobacter kobayashii TaxID=2014872 RepID=A0A402ACD5_9CHLR|nr:hypothetical protein [Dictyobacter kobayashii]GCE16772.1 hypothetical protein KDK_05720 [Dictyobacter kobayashii]
MSQKLTASSIGLRAQEFHEGLKDIHAFGPREAHLQTTILIGKAASLATHLKGLIYVDNMQALRYLAAELGISSIELQPVLRVLEDVDFASVVTAGSQIKRIELRVPELRNGYNDLGERWLQLEPGEIEQSAIALLENVAAFPQGELAIREDLGLDDRVFNTIFTIGAEGALLDKYETPTGDTILYSPLTVEEKPQSLISLAQKFPESDVIAALHEVKRRQGLVMELVSNSGRSVMDQAVLLGVLSPVQLTMGRQNRIFLFSPRGGLEKEERTILEKARAILACVRCGEHYAETRKILYPRRILETLRDSKTFRYPRPDIAVPFVKTKTGPNKIKLSNMRMSILRYAYQRCR